LLFQPRFREEDKVSLFLPPFLPPPAFSLVSSLTSFSSFLLPPAPILRRLSKVYFTWVIRDFSSAEWFRSLLSAIEEQDVDGRIEISIYLTSKISPDEMQNIMLNDVGATRDAITNLVSLLFLPLR
jgi:hypothetical protein